MKMKRILVVILLMTALSPMATAQVPDTQAPGWEIGWEDDEEILIFELDPDTYKFELVIDFWIENTYPFPIDVDFETEIGEEGGTDFGFQTEDPGKVSVPANSNESYELKISCVSSCSAWSARNNFLTTVDFIATNYVAEQAQGSQEISKKLQPSSIYGFEVTFEPLTNSKGPEIKAGTDKQIDVLIWITGNDEDAISKIDMSFRGCPQMKIETKDSGLEAGTKVGDGGDTYKKGSVKLSAPSSHPDKTCKLVVSVTSEGNGISYIGNLEFDVDAPDVSENKEKEEDSNSESSDLTVEDNSMPTISTLLSILTVMFAALIRRNNL